MLGDHWVMSRMVQKEQECPSLDLPGRVDFEVELEFNAYHGDITGAALVTYLEDADGNWEIVAGADPGSGTVDDDSIVAISDSSRNIRPQDRTISLDNELPVGTDATRMLTRVFVFGTESQRSVPLQPDPADVERAMDCP